MKKSILFIVFMFAAALIYAQCDYTIELVDSYGDGWNGGAVDVLVNGSAVLSGLTLATGPGPESHSFTVNTGDAITTDYTAGSWGYENEYYIYDPAHTLVGSDGAGGVEPSDITTPIIVSCPSCAPPSALTVGSITGTSASLGWTENGSATSWDIELGTAGFTATGTPTQSGVTNPYPHTGLVAATSYDWYVRADCGGSQSPWVGPNNFMTTCIATSSFPYTYGFEDQTIGSGNCVADGTYSLLSCWVNDTGDGSDWQAETGATGSGGTGPSAAQEGSNYMYTETSSSCTGPWFLNSPEFDFTGSTDYQVEFYNHMYGSDIGTLDLLVSLDGGSVWSAAIWTLTGDQGDQWNEVIIGLSAYTNERSVILRWDYDRSGTGYAGDCGLDAITVQRQSSCLAPTAQTEASITQTQAELGWTESGSATIWDIEIGVNGFTPTGTPTQSGVTNPYTYTGLTTGTSYDWYVRADCSGTESNWTGPSTFSTLTGPALDVSPASYAFGDNATGYCSGYQTFTISNSGGGSFNITSVSLTGTDASDFEIVDLNTYSVAVNPAITVDVRFCPARDGAKTANLTVVDDLTRTSTDFALTGTGIPPAYCASTGNMSYATSISRVIFNDLDNLTDTTPGVTGGSKFNAYEDFTGTYSATVAPGTAYDLTVNMDTDGSYTCGAIAWIDWNQDYDFADAGEEYILGINNNVNDGPGDLCPLSVTVPAGATLGTTRMRVAVAYNGYATSCATGYDGEVEDYAVVVGSGGTVGNLFISEICDNKAAFGENTGFIEIYNSGTLPRDIEGFAVQLGTTAADVFTPSGTEYTFPAGAEVPAQGYLVVSNGATIGDFNTAWSGIDPALIDGTTYFADGSLLLCELGNAWALDDGIARGELDHTPNMTANGREVQDSPGNWTEPPGGEDQGAPGEQGGGEAPLPVELSEFMAEYVAENLTIFWITQSESNNIGWNVYRGTSEYDIFNNSATQINEDIIEGSGTSIEPTEYSYIDGYPVVEEETYWYWLESVDMSGSTQLYMPFSYTIPVFENEEEAPEIVNYELRNYPNPFNPTTKISFAVKEVGNINLTVYNAKGQKVTTLFNGYNETVDENIPFTWYGKDDSGQSVGSGVYYYKLTAKNRTEIKKMILLK
jgi:hypothetical protein